MTVLGGWNKKQTQTFQVHRTSLGRQKFLNYTDIPDSRDRIAWDLPEGAEKAAKCTRLPPREWCVEQRLAEAQGHTIWQAPKTSPRSTPWSTLHRGDTVTNSLGRRLVGQWRWANVAGHRVTAGTLCFWFLRPTPMSLRKRNPHLWSSHGLQLKCETSLNTNATQILHCVLCGKQHKHIKYDSWQVLKQPRFYPYH